MWPAIIGAAGSILGGLIGKKGADKTNQAQIDMTYDLTQNKHKYAMEDLKRSGLNPLLSVTTPSSAGSAPKLDNPNKQLGESVSAAANSAMSVKLANQQLDNLMAQAENTKADTALKQANKDTVDINNTRLGVTQPLYDTLGGLVNKLVGSAKGAIDGSSAKHSGNAEIDKPLELEIEYGKHKGANDVNLEWLKKNIKTQAEYMRFFNDDVLMMPPKGKDPKLDAMRRYLRSLPKG